MIRRLVQFAFWTAVAAALFFAVRPVPAVIDLPLSDKVHHMLAFFTLAVLGWVAYPRLTAWQLAAGLIAFGGLIELIQMIPALNRQADAVDWGADILAAGAGLATVRLCRNLVGPAR